MFASTLNASTFVRHSEVTTRKSKNCFKKAPQAKASETFASIQKKTAAISATIVATIAPVFPALAIVDDRLNGDGTGLPLGINDGAFGIVLGVVPLGIFALYFTAGKQDSDIIAGGVQEEEKPKEVPAPKIPAPKSPKKATPPAAAAAAADDFVDANEEGADEDADEWIDEPTN